MLTPIYLFYNLYFKHSHPFPSAESRYRPAVAENQHLNLSCIHNLIPAMLRSTKSYSPRTAAGVHLHYDLSQVAVPHLFRLEEFKGINIYECSVEEIQQWLSEGHFTSVDFVEFCLGRIHKVNPYLECIIEVNPDAIRIAAELDDERQKVGGNLAIHRNETRGVT